MIRPVSSVGCLVDIWWTKDVDRSSIQFHAMLEKTGHRYRIGSRLHCEELGNKQSEQP